MLSCTVNRYNCLRVSWCCHAGTNNSRSAVFILKQLKVGFFNCLTRLTYPQLYMVDK